MMISLDWKKRIISKNKLRVKVKIPVQKSKWLEKQKKSLNKKEKICLL